jgi:hypothetical protein
VFSTQYVRNQRDATIEEMFGDVFSERSAPRLPLEENPETAVRRVGGRCEMAASLGVSVLE